VDECLPGVEVAEGNRHGGLPVLLHANVLVCSGTRGDDRAAISDLEVIGDVTVGGVGHHLGDRDAVIGGSETHLVARSNGCRQGVDPFEAEVSHPPILAAPVAFDAMGSGGHGVWAAADEQRHPETPVEAWWFWGWSPDASIGVYAGLEITGQRFDYWAGLVRAGRPYLYVAEIDSTGLRAGLEIKPPEMWAGFNCDAPFEQWSFGNEAHGVLLDEPDEAFGRAYGDLVPVTFDVEWYASGPPEVIRHGYAQTGEVDAEIELLEGMVRFEGPGHRVHVWGSAWLPDPPGAPTGWGLRAPYRRRDGVGVEQVLTADGWHPWVRGARTAPGA